jgi:hypothetical protein
MQKHRSKGGMKTISRTALMDLLDYCPETGVFTWRPRRVDQCATARGCAIFNGRYAGTVAGASDGGGYIRMSVQDAHYRAHRLAWAYVHDEWPKEIDHINHDRSDNRISNLRPVTRSQNNTNRRMMPDHKSGTYGVYWVTRSRRWFASIGAGDNRVILGRFKEKADAVAARRKEEARLGFHENHGRAITQDELARLPVERSEAA